MKRCTYDDIVHFVFFELGGKVNIDLDTTLGILFFDSLQERVEPLRSAVVTNNPSEVYLDQGIDQIVKGHRD